MKLLACSDSLYPFPRLGLHLRQVLLTVACALALAGPAQAQVIDIDAEALAELRDKGVPVIDIRRLDEWIETGVVEGSHLMTFFDERGNYDAQGWFENFRTQVDADQPVVLICRTGVRTGKVTAWLSERMNISTVYNVKEGIVGWKSEGGVTVPAP